MSGVHLPAANTFSSRVSIPVDISRITFGYDLKQPCAKFYLILEKKKENLYFISTTKMKLMKDIVCR